MNLLNRTGNIEDIRNTFKCNTSNGYVYSLEDLTAALKDENKKQKRKTVVKFLQAQINKKKKQESQTEIEEDESL